ncbi:catalase HPII, partial [Micromonospora sp. NPDC047753]
MDSSKPAEAVKNAVKTASGKIADALSPDVPGAPGSAPPTVEEPTTPHDPLPPKPEQGAPQTRTPTGAETGAPTTANGQQGAYLTTANGARLRDTDHSLKAGPRGPVLLQDHHLDRKSTRQNTRHQY